MLVLSPPLAPFSRDVAPAIWRPHLGAAEVIRPKGRSMVHTGIQRGSRLYLLPEEAAYLVDRGDIILLVEEEDEEEEQGEESGEAPPAKRAKGDARKGRGAAREGPRSRRLRLLSLEESIDLVAQAGVPPEVHMVYTKLSRAGYTLQRHPAVWIVPPTGKLPGEGAAAAAAAGEAGEKASNGAAPEPIADEDEWNPDKWDAEEWDPDAWDAEENAGALAGGDAEAAPAAAPATLEHLASLEEDVVSKAGGWEAWAQDGDAVGSTEDEGKGAEGAEATGKEGSAAPAPPARSHWWSAAAPWPFAAVPPPSGSGAAQKKERLAALGQASGGGASAPSAAPSSAPAPSASPSSSRAASAGAASTSGQPWWATQPWCPGRAKRGARAACAVASPASLRNPLLPGQSPPIYPSALSLGSLRSLFPRLRPMRLPSSGEIARATAFGSEGQVGDRKAGAAADAATGAAASSPPGAVSSDPLPPALLSAHSMLSPSAPLALHLDVWEPGCAFSRKAPGPPSFRVAVVPSTVSPNVGDLQALKALSDDDVPVKIATVIAGDIGFYGFNAVQLKQLPIWKR